MNCQILRNPKTGKISRVNAPNGNESILYKSILDSIPAKIELDDYLKEAIVTNKIKDTTPEEIALGIWSKVYTSNFKEWFGDWQKDFDSKINKWLKKNNNSLNQTLNDFGFTKGKIIEEFKIIPSGKGFDLIKRIPNINNKGGQKGYIEFIDEKDISYSKIREMFGINLLDKNGEPLYSEDLNLFNGGDFPIHSGNIYYQLSNEEVNEISPSLEKTMMDLVKSVGGSVKLVDEITDENGNKVNAYGKMNALNNVIELLKTGKPKDTLVEETAHMITALLGPNHPLMKQMMSQITDFQIYYDVKEQYKDIYNSENDFRFEAVGKMISKHIIKGEALGSKDRKTANSWFQRVINKLAEMFYGKKLENISTEMSVFEKAAKMFINKDILNELKPSNSETLSVEELAREFNMSNAGFIDGKKANYDELKIKAKKADVELATSENGNFYFKKNGKRINPFKSFYQLKDTKSQSEIVKSLLDTHARVSPEKHKYIDKYGVERETYKLDNGQKIVENRVSGLQDEKFNKNKTAEEILKASKNPRNAIFREVGTELHDISEQLMQVGVSKRDNLELTANIKVPSGEPKATPTITKGKINTIGKSINNLLNDIEEIQRGIDPSKKATVITENFVYDEAKDIGGSQDVLVVFSDGSASIYDYKFINFDHKADPQSEIPFSKRNSYHLQIGEYKRILKQVYGIKHFRETRILPFSVQYELDKNNPAGIKKQVRKIEGFDKSSDKNFLVPLPVADELTGNKKLDEILKSLFNREQILTKKISQNWMNPLVRNPLVDELDSIKKSQKEIQVKSNLEPLINSINKTLDNLARISEDVSVDSIQDLVDIDAELKLYKGIYKNAIPFIDEKLKPEFDKVSSRLDLAEDVVKDKLIEILTTFHEDINVPQREMDFLPSVFNTMSDMNHPVFEVARKLIAESYGDTRRMLQEFLEELEVKKNNLESWAKSRGTNLKDVYKSIINESTGNLKGKFSSEFHDKLISKRLEGDSKWFKDNYEITEEGKKKYQEDLELYEKSLIGNGQKYIDFKLNEWKNKHDLSKDSAWLNSYTLYAYTKLKQPEKHYSDMYKNLIQDSNKPLREFYDYYTETNRFFNSLVDDQIDSNFVANISKDLIDSLVQGDNILQSLKNTKTNFINSLKVRQNDTIKIEGEDNNIIPLLYKDSFSYRDENGNWVNGLDNKSIDLATNLTLFAESVFNKHNMSKIKGTIEGLKLLINNQKVLKTNNFGKVETIDGELQPTISEKGTNAKVLASLTDALVYQKRIQNKDRHLNIAGHTISSNKLIAKLMSYMSTKSLAFNYVSGLGNFAGAYSNAYIKGVGGKYYTNKQMWEAHKLQFSRSNKDLYNHITEFWNVGNPHWAKDQAMKMSLSKATKNLTHEKWYLLQEKGDEFVANNILVSMMQNYGLNENGTPTRLTLLPEGSKSLYDRIKRENDKFEIEGLSNEAFDDFRKMVLYVNKQVKGTANPEDISMINTTIWGKSLMHFKSWIAPMVKERYGDMKYTPEVREWEYGRYRSLATQLFNKKFIPNLIKLSIDVITLGKIKYKGDIALLKEQFEKWKKDNPDIADKITESEYLELRERTIRESIHEIKILGAMFLMIMAARGDWDDDGEADYKKNVLTKQLYKILVRSQLELSFFTNPTSFRDLVKTPIPVIQIGIDAVNFMDNTADETTDILFGENNNKDRTGKGHYTKKMFPVTKHVFDFLEDFNTED